MDLSPSSRGPTLTYGVEFGNVVDARFLVELMDRGLTAVRGTGWVTRATIEDAPGAVIASASYFQPAQDECVAVVGEALVHVILNDRSLLVRSAASDLEGCEAALRVVREAMPEVAVRDQEVPARFWCCQMGPAGKWHA